MLLIGLIFYICLSFFLDTMGFYIAIVTRGSGNVESNENELRALGFGDRFLVPAATGALSYSSEAGMDLILTYPPA